MLLLIMTKLDIERLLKKSGFTKRSGGRHDVWCKDGYPPIPVPRHKGDIPRGTVQNILKAAKIGWRK